MQISIRSYSDIKDALTREDESKEWEDEIPSKIEDEISEEDDYVFRDPHLVELLPKQTGKWYAFYVDWYGVSTFTFFLFSHV